MVDAVVPGPPAPIASSLLCKNDVKTRQFIAKPVMDVRLAFGLEGTGAAMPEEGRPAYAGSVTLVLASAKQSLD